MRKEQALPIAMRATALGMGAAMGLSHLFFPTHYFSWMAQKRWNHEDPFHHFLANVIGVLVIALCVGLWYAARDPRRYRLVITQFFVASALIAPVYLYHLLNGSITGSEWAVLVGVVVVNLVFIKLYPGPDYEG